MRRSPSSTDAPAFVGDFVAATGRGAPRSSWEKRANEADLRGRPASRTRAILIPKAREGTQSPGAAEERRRAGDDRRRRSKRGVRRERTQCDGTMQTSSPQGVAAQNDALAEARTKPIEAPGRRRVGSVRVRVRVRVRRNRRSRSIEADRATEAAGMKSARTDPNAAVGRVVRVRPMEGAGGIRAVVGFILA